MHKHDKIPNVTHKNKKVKTTMVKLHKATKRYSLRAVYKTAAVIIAAVSAVPLLTGIAFATPNLLTSRAIEMSDSTASATNVTYHVSFNTIATGNTQAFIVDFCDNSPILNDTTCNTPGGFTLTASPTVSGQSSTAGCSVATFTTVSTLNSNRTLELSAGSAVNFTVSSCAVSFDITTVTNPNTADHSFYARVYTWDTTGHANGYTAGTSYGAAGNLDAGGIALSTASNINVTGKVQEQLTFCVYQTSCGTPANVTLGTNGVLSTTNSYVDKNAKYDIQTNASSGAIVRVKGPTLTSGANTIAAITGSPALYSAGTSQFGMCTYQSAGANLTPNANYIGTNGGNDCTSTAQGSNGDGSAKFYYNGAGSTYGDPMSSEAAGTSSTGIIAMLGSTSATQVAGIYTTTLVMIATGTF